MSRILPLVQVRSRCHELIYHSVLIIDFREMWWGSTQMMGNPEKIVVFIKID